MPENETMLVELIKASLPELYELYDILNTNQVEPTVVLECVDAIKRVARHGSGLVQVTVTNGQTMKIEATTRTVFAQERLKEQVKSRGFTLRVSENIATLP